MIKFLKVFSVLVVLVGLGYGGVCAYQTFISGAGVDPEFAMPKDLSMVFALDHSNFGQVKNLNKLLKKFPKDDSGIEYLKSMYNQNVGAEFSYEELQKLLSDSWKIVVGVKMNMDESATAPTEVYIAGIFDNADKIESLLKLETSENKNYVYTEKDNVKYWDNEVDDIYILRYKKMFVVTNSLKNKEMILPRIKNKDGLVVDENFVKMKKSLDKDVLVYAYVNLLNWGGANPEITKDLGAVYSVLMAVDDGFGVKSYTELKSKNLPIVKAMIDAPKPSIVDKVNATNIIAYAENPELGAILKVVSAEYLQTGSDLTEIVAEVLKVDKDDISTLIDNLVAFSISADSHYYPSISVYLKIDEKIQDSAQKIVDAMDNYMDEMVDSFKKIVEEQEAEKLTVVEGKAPPAITIGQSDKKTVATEFSDVLPKEFFVKKESIDTNGMDMKYWYIDWDFFPVAEFKDIDLFFKDQLKIAEGVKAVKLGFYYGFPEDGMMMISLQPDLLATYGKTPLSADPIFKEAVSKIGDKGWVSISYFRPENLFLVVNNYIKLAITNPLLAGTVAEAYNSVEGIFSTFEYFVNGQMIEGDAIVSQGYAKVEKFKKAVVPEENFEVKNPQGDVLEDDMGVIELPVVDDVQIDDTVDNEAPPKIKRVK